MFATSRALLAGLWSPKNSSYTWLKSAKSSILSKNTLHFIILSTDEPASSTMALIFSRALFVAFLISLSSSPVAGSNGSWPDVKIRLSVAIACTYAPTAAGACLY